MLGLFRFENGMVLCVSFTPNGGQHCGRCDTCRSPPVGASVARLSQTGAHPIVGSLDGHAVKALRKHLCSFPTANGVQPGPRKTASRCAVAQRFHDTAHASEGVGHGFEWQDALALQHFDHPLLPITGVYRVVPSGKMVVVPGDTMGFVVRRLTTQSLSPGPLGNNHLSLGTGR